MESIAIAITGNSYTLNPCRILPARFTRFIRTNAAGVCDQAAVHVLSATHTSAARCEKRKQGAPKVTEPKGEWQDLAAGSGTHGDAEKRKWCIAPARPGLPELERRSSGRLCAAPGPMPPRSRERYGSGRACAQSEALPRAPRDALSAILVRRRRRAGRPGNDADGDGGGDAGPLVVTGSFCGLNPSQPCCLPPGRPATARSR
jgi:hypothetical protein